MIKEETPFLVKKNFKRFEFVKNIFILIKAKYTYLPINTFMVISIPFDGNIMIADIYSFIKYN